jgi:hypothetical protein
MQVVSREDAISNLKMELRDDQDCLTKREAAIQRLEKEIKKERELNRKLSEEVRKLPQVYCSNSYNSLPLVHCTVSMLKCCSNQLPTLLNFMLLFILLQLSRIEITLHQTEDDLQATCTHYKAAVEDNGRLEARIQAFAINAQSEQDCLTEEVGTFSWTCCLTMLDKGRLNV